MNANKKFKKLENEKNYSRWFAFIRGFKEKIFTETGTLESAEKISETNCATSSRQDEWTPQRGVPTKELENEFVVVQGVVDLAVILPREIWLVDFKTDDFSEGDLPEKIKIYKPQLQLYAAALEKIYSRSVKLRTLHFLSAQKTIEI